MAARRAMTGPAVVAMAAAVTVLVMCSAMASAEVDCSEQFGAMHACVEFISNNTLNVPGKQCCSAFQATFTTAPVCLCQLQQTFADPATAPGNATRANQLPTLCAVAVDPSRCPALLGLAPAVAPAAPVALAPAPPKGADVDCTTEINSLASCITFVTSNDTVPTADCCTSLKTVHVTQPVCLCQLLQQVNGDPTMSTGVNVTKALELPNVCKTGADVNNCPALLGQPAASPLGEPVAPAPGTVSAPAPEAGAPGIVSGAPPVAQEESPVVAGPNGNGATSNLGATSIAMLLGCIASSLHLLF